ncbi:MAG: aminotransferase, partial [Gemmatimonadetes bacterium]|nr:aminotransferase [Gemmatimonadota bacterium]
MTMLSCQKQLFSLPDNVHYLNCAYMSPLLRRVEQAGIEGLRRKRLPAGIAPEDFFR